MVLNTKKIIVSAVVFVVAATLIYIFSQPATIGDFGGCFGRAAVVSVIFYLVATKVPSDVVPNYYVNGNGEKVYEGEKSKD